MYIYIRLLWSIELRKMFYLFAVLVFAVCKLKILWPKALHIDPQCVMDLYSYKVAPNLVAD